MSDLISTNNSAVLNEELRLASMEILRESVFSFIIFLIAGLVAALTGILSLVAISKSKEMKSKFYALYAEMAVTDLIMGVVYVGTAIKKIYRTYSGIGDAMTHWTCCKESAILYFSQTLDRWSFYCEPVLGKYLGTFVLGLYVACTLAVDRTVSFLKPVKYKYMKAKYITYPLIATAWGLTSLETVLMLYLGQTDESAEDEVLVSCGTASCWFIRSYFTTLYGHLLISMCVVCLNFYLMFLARNLMHEAEKRKALKLKSSAEERRLKSQNRFQMKVIKTLSVMVMSHATSHISSRLLLLVLLHLNHRDPELTVLGSCARNLVVINASLHFFFYYFTSSEFHSAVNNVLRQIFHIKAQGNTIFPLAAMTLGSPSPNFLLTDQSKSGVAKSEQSKPGPFQQPNNLLRVKPTEMPPNVSRQRRPIQLKP